MERYLKFISSKIENFAFFLIIIIQLLVSYSGRSRLFEEQGHGIIFFSAKCTTTNRMKIPSLFYTRLRGFFPPSYYKT